MITPLVRADAGSNNNNTVLVNRGWIPRHFVVPQVSQSWAHPEGKVQVVGIPAKPERECDILLY